MAVLGLDPRINPAIGYPHQFANGAIPVSNHPMEMPGSSHDVVRPLLAVRQQQGPLVVRRETGKE